MFGNLKYLGLSADFSACHQQESLTHHNSLSAFGMLVPSHQFLLKSKPLSPNPFCMFFFTTYYLQLKQIKYANEFSIWGWRLNEKGVAWNLQSLRVEPASASGSLCDLGKSPPLNQFPLLWNGGNNRNVIWIWYTFHELMCVKQIIHAHMANKSLFSHSFLNYVVLPNRYYLLHSPLKRLSSIHTWFISRPEDFPCSLLMRKPYHVLLPLSCKNSFRGLQFLTYTLQSHFLNYIFLYNQINSLAFLPDFHSVISLSSLYSYNVYREEYRQKSVLV